MEIRKESYANIVLPIGTTMFQRTVERMTKIDGAATSTMKIMVVAPPVKALGLDWRIDLVFPQHILAGVDLEGRVRWILPDHRS